MPKNLLQDMVKVKHASREKQIFSEEVRYEKILRTKNKEKKPRRYKLWLIALVSLTFFIFAVSHLFSKVVVTVNPKIKDVVLNENLSASKDGSAETLPFDSIIISGEESKMVQTTEEKEVSLKAEGVVVIYNAFGSAPQMLSVDTRLIGSNNKTYKTKKQIFVPGMKNSIPGSIEVGIYGAGAGEEYNSGPLDFTIFGFKGTPKYSKFYARSKGEITGGLKGKFPFIPENQKASILSDMKKALQAQLFKKATDQIPNELVLFENAIFLDIDDNNIDFSSSKNNTLPMKLKGTLYGLLFNIDKLTKKIAENNIEGYDGSPIIIPNIKNLTFSLSAEQAGLLGKKDVSFGDFKNINFNLSGSAKIVWKVDENKLIADLLGQSKKNFKQILLRYPYINSANLVISPFWKIYLPDKTKNLQVIVNYPK